jgi:hypothetical protein
MYLTCVVCMTAEVAFLPHTLPVFPLLVHGCTQVHRLSQTPLTESVQVRETDVSKCVCPRTSQMGLLRAHPPRPPRTPPSSLTHVHNIQTPILPTPTLLTFTCTQVLWFLSSLTRSRTSGVTTRPATSLTIFLPAQPSVCEAFRSLRFSVLSLIIPTPIYVYSL